MVELFADLPEALENSVEIAKRCNLQITLGKSYLPDFPTPEGVTLDDFLSPEAVGGLEVRLQQLFPDPAERERSARHLRSAAASSRPTPSSRWASPATS
jgi:DNA polymerase-3 subunit alpha